MQFLHFVKYRKKFFEKKCGRGFKSTNIAHAVKKGSGSNKICFATESSEAESSGLASEVTKTTEG